MIAYVERLCTSTKEHPKYRAFLEDDEGDTLLYFPTNPNAKYEDVDWLISLAKAWAKQHGAEYIGVITAGGEVLIPA